MYWHVVCGVKLELDYFWLLQLWNGISLIYSWKCETGSGDFIWNYRTIYWLIKSKHLLEKRSSPLSCMLWGHLNSSSQHVQRPTALIVYSIWDCGCNVVSLILLSPLNLTCDILVQMVQICSLCLIWDKCLCFIAGYFSQISTLADVQENVMRYLHVMSRPKVIDHEHDTVWTEAYVDSAVSILWCFTLNGFLSVQVVNRSIHHTLVCVCETAWLYVPWNKMLQTDRGQNNRNL